MAKPRIELWSIEPSESEVVQYAPLAERVNGDGELGRLMLSMTLVNSEPTAVELQDLLVVIPNLDYDTERRYSLEAGGASLKIAPGARATWFFTSAIQSILFSLVPPPTEIRLEVRAVGFSDPVTFVRSLRPHRAPTPSGAYRFPALASELDGEFWYGHGNTHPPFANAVQGFAYDLEVWGRHGDKGRPWLKTARDQPRNEDCRAWGKRVYAMADGVVRQAVNHIPENPHPLAAGDAAGVDRQAKVWGAFPAALHPYAGCHLHLQHGSETVLYAHLQPGSIPERLLVEKTEVAAGEFLGLVGNSGNSSAPHLHLHAVRGTDIEGGPAQPLVFAPASFVEFALLSSSPVPWVQATAGRSLPAVKTAIWPSVPPPPERLAEETLVDPLSLVLSHDLYVKLKLPNPPPDEIMLGLVEQIVGTAAPAERRLAVQRLHVAITALQSAAKTIEGAG